MVEAIAMNERSKAAAVERAYAQSMLRALKEVIRRAVQVMMARRDIDERFIMRSGSIAAVGDPNFAYGYNQTIVRFVPTPREISQAEIVDGWLVWLREQKPDGLRQLNRVLAWAIGRPQWALAQQENCSERTIANRIDRSVALILRQFGDLDAGVDLVDEPAEEPVLSFSSPAGHTQAGVRREFGKVWISGVGFMKDGRALNDGRQKASARRLYHDRPG